MPSVIFFDGKGDEVGGMLFGVRETTNGYSAIRHLSLDAHEQDQTVVLAHYQDPSGSTSGLTVSDRPTHSQFDTMSQLGLKPSPTRDDLTAAIRALPEERRGARLRELFGTARAFFGTSRTGEAGRRDGQGRQRIILETPKEGAPSLRILDEAGNTIARLPESSQ